MPSHLAFHSCTGEKTNLENEEANFLEFKNPCPPLLHHLFQTSRKPTIHGATIVTYSTSITSRKE